MTTFLQQQPDRDRVLYSYAYSPRMDYAVSAMAKKGSFSYWLNWAAPKYIGAYRTKLYDVYVDWLETGDVEKWKTMMSVANIRFVVSPKFKLALPEEPALERVFHNLLYDVHEYKGAGGTWQIYPARAVRSPNPRLWDQELFAAHKQQRALVAGEYSDFQDQLADTDISAHAPGRIVQWSRPASSRSWAQVEFTEPGILMWSESFHPAWRVQIDGQSAELLRVNHAFMGVRVPTGGHRILFAFGPYPWRWLGALISMASLAGLLIITRLLGWWRDVDEH